MEVTLTNGFWVGKNEVTQSEWHRVMQTAPWSGNEHVRIRDDCPATYVTWVDATKFCEKFTSAEHQAGRLPSDWIYGLPTESQWEYACRAGTTSRFSFGDDESELSQYAWFDRNADKAGEPYAHSAGQKKLNPWNLGDMHGNVWEWCRDVYAKDLLGGVDPEQSLGRSIRVSSSVKLPAKQLLGRSPRVLRGDGWEDKAVDCRSACRLQYRPSRGGPDLGFRVAIVCP